MALNLLGKKSNTDLGDAPQTGQTQEAAAVPDIGEKPKKGKRTGKAGKAKADAAAGNARPDLAKLKKKELLEILVAQGEEIDALRAQVVTLQAQLADREFQMQNVGSIAQASLQVTDIFKEAEKAAKIYLENIRRRYV